MVLKLYLPRETRILPFNKDFCKWNTYPQVYLQHGENAYAFMKIIGRNIFLNQTDILKIEEWTHVPHLSISVFLFLISSWVITACYFFAYLQWWGQTYLELFFHQEKQVTDYNGRILSDHSTSRSFLLESGLTLMYQIWWFE